MSKKKAKQRVVIVSDPHCGHRAGLTPPNHWQYGTSYYAQQKKTWDFYEKAIKSLQPIDILLCNGDAIDGKGDRSGGTEIYESDRQKQAKIAKECLEISKAKQYIIVAGTPYHVGAEEDFERQLAWDLNTELEGHAFFEVNGVKFDATHKIGSSSVPHARYTALARSKLWNNIWAIKKGQPNSDIIIRSHVHYFLYAGDSSWLGIITPALQGFGSKYGVRQCQGTVDFGLVWVDVYEDGTFDWGHKIMEYSLVEKNGRFESRLG